jgi:hypothetical protein
MLLAVRVNDEFTKEQILEQYLNTVYFGQGSYGIKSAASRFFRTTDANGVERGKHLDELTVADAALLAGLISNPEGNNPFEHPERAKARRATVLDMMRNTGAITDAQIAEARTAPLPNKKPAPVIELLPPPPRAAGAVVADISLVAAISCGEEICGYATESLSQSPAPATNVSFSWASGESPSPSAAAIPPCAHLVEPSSTLAFVTSNTERPKVRT